MEDEGIKILKMLLLGDTSPNEKLYDQVRNKLKQLISNKQQVNIYQQLSQASLDDDLKNYWDKNLIGMNGVFFSTVFLTQFLFKRKVFKIFYLLSCSYFSFYVMQPIQFEYQLRMAARQNNLVGQEVRNLYRFYFPEEQFTKEYEQHCKTYLESEKIRKEIYSRKK